jgi:hypothetical protein
VISVHILRLDDGYTTTIMPQATEITQFIFGQPLSRSARTKGMLSPSGLALGHTPVGALTPAASALTSSERIDHEGPRSDKSEVQIGQAR